MTEPIELRDVSKSYVSAGVLAMIPLPEVASWFGLTRKTAVDRVSLTVRSGERVGIIGRNGAGKTTLLKLIANLAQPSSGVVNVRGRVTTIMTLGLAVREDLTGRENIYIEGEVQGRTRSDIARIVEDVIAFADLGQFIDYPVRTYSTGMKARLAFATATHIDPDILIIDEALSVGDAAFAVKANRMIRRLCGRGRIVIIVSHSMNAVVDLCSRCLWMDSGRIVMDGDPVNVTQAYVTTVRRQDDLALLARFNDVAVAHSHHVGCDITAFEVTQGGDAEARAIVTAGLDTFVHWAAQVPAGLANFCVRLRAVRLDGLVVIDSEQARADALAATGTFVGRIGMRPLVLGAGVYRLSLELRTGGELLADRSTAIEVVAPDAPRGGRTALLYPSIVTVEPVG
jgi:homopolymeric O-antigen transport system ATP-binding protein